MPPLIKRVCLIQVMNYLSNVITVGYAHRDMTPLVLIMIKRYFQGFLAVGILEMRGVAGHAGWRWMFLLEGLATLVIALASFFMMPPGPSQTKARWRKQGYFTDNEVKIVVNKSMLTLLLYHKLGFAYLTRWIVLRDDPGKSSMVRSPSKAEAQSQDLNLGLLQYSTIEKVFL
jgi:MFS family permease